jgi:hypothetical protein
LPNNPGTIIPDETTANPLSGKRAAKSMYNQTRIISLDYRTEAQGFGMLCRNGSLRFNVDNLKPSAGDTRQLYCFPGWNLKQFPCLITGRFQPG